MFVLKELSLNDGVDIYNMLREIGPGETGFVNEGYNLGFNEFSNFLKKHINMSKGIDLEFNQVPQTTYWMFKGEKVVGLGKLRHYLNDNLRKIGGQIGYCIRPTERGKGYGKLILKELLLKAKEKNINEILMTCIEGNILSRKVIERNNGVLTNICEGECYYSIMI